MDGLGRDLEFGFPALALCQFCDNCGPQIILVTLYDVNAMNLEPQAVVPRETNCKICYIGEPLASVVIYEKLYAVLRHSCIYSLTAESPLCKFSTYSDQDGWRLMLHFVVKDIYGRANIRRLSLVFYSNYERPLDIVDVSEKLKIFSETYRTRALQVFDAEKDSISGWRMKSAESKEKHSRSFCTITNTSPETLRTELVKLTSDCHNWHIAQRQEIFDFEDDWESFWNIEFYALFSARKCLCELDFATIMTKLVQGDQIVIISASESVQDTSYADDLVKALSALLPNKITQPRLIGSNGPLKFVEAWESNLVAMKTLEDVPIDAIENDPRVLLIALNVENTISILSKWCNDNNQADRKPCSLGKRYTALFSSDVRGRTVNEIIGVIKAEFFLQSKLVYCLNRLPDQSFKSASSWRKSQPPSAEDRVKRVEQVAQLSPGDFCQLLFWASALSGETRRRIVDTSDNMKSASSDFYSSLKKLFLQ